MSREKLTGRVDRLEQGAGPTASRLSWQAELDRLEAEHAREFPNLPEAINSFTGEEADRYLAFHCSETAGRMGWLREKLMTPQERADLAAFTIALESMSIKQLDEYMAVRCTAPPEEETLP